MACDHAGYLLKNEIIKHLKNSHFELKDHGCFSEESVDYPDFAALVARDVQQKLCDSGILVCGTGIGMSITANKFKGVRSASISDIFSVEMSRKHNDLNILCLGSRVLQTKQALTLVDVFLSTEFEGERHAKRVKKMMGYEEVL